MMNRFANIFWHYYAGAIIGLNQKLWPPEMNYPFILQISAIALYMLQALLLMSAGLSPLTRLGLALIVFSPQWLYFWPIPHPVFEFRGYGMAAGVAIVLASLGSSHPVLLVPVALLWTRLTIARHQIVIEPLRFWKQALEEHHGT